MAGGEAGKSYHSPTEAFCGIEQGTTRNCIYTFVVGPKMANVASSSADRGRLASAIATAYTVYSHNVRKPASHAGLSAILGITTVVDEHYQEARPTPDQPKNPAGAMPFRSRYCYTIQVVGEPSL